MNANASLKCKSDEIITGHINPEIVFKCALVSCTSLVACLPVEIFMRQGGWASISKGSVMVSLKWFTIAWTCSSSRFKAVCFISSASMVFGAIWALKKPS
jgi:predicted phage tail protein